MVHYRLWFIDELHQDKSPAEISAVIDEMKAYTFMPHKYRNVPAPKRPLKFDDYTEKNVDGYHIKEFECTLVDQDYVWHFYDSLRDFCKTYKCFIEFYACDKTINVVGDGADDYDELERQDIEELIALEEYDAFPNDMPYCIIGPDGKNNWYDSSVRPEYVPTKEENAEFVSEGGDSRFMKYIGNDRLEKVVKKKLAEYIINQDLNIEQSNVIDNSQERQRTH